MVNTNSTDNSFSLIPFEMYSELIKGKQTFLLLFTALFAYLISAYPDDMNLGELLLLMFSLFFAVAGSTLLNMWIDRDIDAKMERTKDRALPSGRISASSVLWHGLVFSIFGVSLAYFLNILTMVLIFMGLFIDVVVYSMWLKRRTKWSIIFGGISGGLPAMAGRTAVINQIDIEGILFLMIILLWIPLHILSLATIPKNLEGYREAGVPMWPVASGVEQTRTVITIAAFLDGLILVSTSYYLDIHWATRIPLYFLGFAMTMLSYKNFRNPSHEGTFKLFKFASMFMAITFIYLFIAKVITYRLAEIYG